MAKKPKTERDVIAARNRAQFPEIAKVVDQARALWPGVKVVRITLPKDPANH